MLVPGPQLEHTPRTFRRHTSQLIPQAPVAILFAPLGILIESFVENWF
jgi:hypothetical protein